MGYVVNQASMYTFKGERLNLSKDFLEILEKYSDDQSIGDHYEKSSQFREIVESLSKKYSKYFKISEYDIGQNRMKPCFFLLDKTFPFTMKMNHAFNVATAIVNKYGSRSKASSVSASNTDWKATMHAIRIVDEGLQLLGTKQLKFPFSPEYVQKLLSIRHGEVPLSDITDELTSKLDQLKQLELETDLPAYSSEMQNEFNEWFVSWLRKFYGLKMPQKVSRPNPAHGAPKPPNYHPFG